MPLGMQALSKGNTTLTHLVLYDVTCFRMGCLVRWLRREYQTSKSLLLTAMHGHAQG